MKNKAIIFDMGGVLVDLDLEDCKRAFKEDLNYYGIDEILDPCHQKGIWGDLEEGMLSAEDFRKIVLADSRPDAQPEDVDKAMWRILSGIAPYKAELLKKLAQKYDLYLLSNNNSICLPCSAGMFDEVGAPLDEVFKKCFYSFEMKALKPSEKFYKAVIEQIGLPGEQMLFIDDSQKNVDGAIAAGLPAVYYQPGTDLSALLADVLSDPSLKMEGEGR
ncbi:MAG: HAD family phosphatase [Bacteroidales bacterium]|nr:HAD family phosphatase [Bacteroidales bacterium]